MTVIGRYTISLRLCLYLASIIPLFVFLIFLSITYRIYPKKPLCSISQFHINSSPPNSTISFDLRLVNQERFHGVYYDPLNLTFSYRPTTTNNNNKSMAAIAVHTFPGFYQGYFKTVHRSSLVEALDGAAVLNGTTSFRVKLETMVKFKSLWGMKKKSLLRVAADFKVECDTGNKAGKKRIKLKWTNAAVAVPPCLRRLVAVVVLSTAVILML